MAPKKSKKPDKKEEKRALPVPVTPAIVAEVEEKEPEEESENALVPIKADDSLPSRSDPLYAYMREVNRYPLLSREEEAEIVKHYLQHQDRESAQKLVTSNLRLVVKIAMEYRRAFTNVLDLIQEGNMGLMRAVIKYDPTKGTRFSYYASWWIKAFILKYLLDNFSLVKIGTTQAQKKLFYNLMKEKQKIEAMGFTPKAKLLSDTLNVKEKEVVEMEQRMGGRDMRLDAPNPHAEGKLNMDLFVPENDAATSAQATTEQNELKNILFKNLDEFVGTLKEKEQKIFSERLYAELPKTLQEIADEYGITRERVRQLEERVVDKLKNFFSEKGFEVDLTKGKK
ncbi:RNA polymerase factor sigma-32 [bacterium]|nr:RNA polymerase factor sigma-32 [bacterium]